MRAVVLADMIISNVINVDSLFGLGKLAGDYVKMDKGNRFEVIAFFIFHQLFSYVGLIIDRF